MELILQNGLEHQTLPVECVADVVSASHLDTGTPKHCNPALTEPLGWKALYDARQKAKLSADLQESLVEHPDSYRTKQQDMPPYQMLDVKMETGTGKTYVYVKTIYELHKRTKLNKFIIAVPTLPIKAGTGAFLDDAYVQRHFSDTCGYNTRIEFCLLETQKKKKKGRATFPPAVGKFFYGSRREQNRIYVLLMNTQLLTNGKLLTRDDYFQPVGDFDRPVDAIADTRPVLIIDEPHRMDRESKSFVQLIKQFRPQLVLRYGATFPEVTVGAGKNKKTVKDYVNLVYDLNACAAFDQNLIKGVAKEHLELGGGRRQEKKIKITGIENKTSVSLQYITPGRTTRHVLHTHDSLAMIDPDMDGLTIEGITATGIELSNGQQKLRGEEFLPDQYSASYQEGMMRKALERHFQTERENFMRSPARIKTLALFFIDNIESYRGPEKKNDGWLRRKFLELLGERIGLELHTPGTSPEYAAYLQATLDHIDDEACAAYFAQDNQDTDEMIAEEVQTILHDKKQLLSFEREDGTPNVCRFLFSKWTLKEGWDNPNVFTICKLRSSGSETSKLQEVGRGLRLPVDEAGNRIQDESFMLNYIVDFTERQFAEELVAEINGGIVKRNDGRLVLTDQELTRVARLLDTDENQLMIALLTKGYVDFQKIINQGTIDQMERDYPQFFKNGKIRNVNAETGKVHIRRERFNELKTLWERLNAKYIIYFDRNIDDALRTALPGLIRSKDVFALQVATSVRDVVGIEEGRAVSREAASSQLTLGSRCLPYNEFLKRASRTSCVPITDLHKAFCEVTQGGMNIAQEMFNENSLARLLAAISEWKADMLSGCVRYKQGNYSSLTTRLTDGQGEPLAEVAQVHIGRRSDDGTVSPKYLYDELVYDSPLERQNIIHGGIDEVTVYGKIPSSSICIPTVASSNFSPDFMFVVRRKNGPNEVNIVIETKDYDSKDGIPKDQLTKITCAEKFFNDMQEHFKDKGFTIRFKPQLRTDAVKSIIDGLIKE